MYLSHQIVQYTIYTTVKTWGLHHDPQLYTNTHKKLLVYATLSKIRLLWIMKITILMWITQLITNKLLLTRISYFCIVRCTIEWLHGHSRRNCLLWGHQPWKPSKLSIGKTKPHKSVFYGRHHKSTSSNVPLVWLYLCTPPAVRKFLKNTFIFMKQVMLNLGRSELPPKLPSKFKSWKMILQSKTNYAHTTILDICILNFY